MKRYSRLLQKYVFHEDYLRTSPLYFLLLAWKIAEEDNRNNFNSSFFTPTIYLYQFCRFKKTWTISLYSTGYSKDSKTYGVKRNQLYRRRSQTLWFECTMFVISEKGSTQGVWPKRPWSSFACLRKFRKLDP